VSDAVVGRDDTARVLTSEHYEVKAFYESQEVKGLLSDKEMFEYYFKTMENLSEWTEYYNEPTRKVKYKYEEGMTLVSCLCEAIVEAPLLNVLALFSEVELFKDWFPNVTSCDLIKEVTPIRGLYNCRQSMPWPIWPRQMTMEASGMFDKKNIGILSVIKSTAETG
jgi:hypothetical protein